MKHTIQYVISSFLLLYCLQTTAQETETKDLDSVKYSQKHGLRIGTDLSKLIRTVTDNDYSGFEINADFRLTKKLYIAGELGTEEKTTNTNFLNTTASGSYIKTGIDYNMFTNWLGMNNMIYSGFRTGFSTFSQTRNSYTIYNENQYWQPQFTNTKSEEFNGLSAIWVELIFGIKAEIFTNFYVGINAQLKGTLTNKNPDGFENHYIPGFNKTYNSGKFGVGYGYTVSYVIPLFKKDK